jgi:hypothetical protein
MFTPHGDVFAVRVVSRNRIGGEYSLHEFFQETDSVSPVLKKLDVNYICDNWDKDSSSNTISFEKKDSASFFPAVLKDPNKNKSGLKFQLEGVVMCLNEGQSEGLMEGVNLTPTKQNALSQLDPILTPCTL